jgi:hypothetical protein
VKDFLKLFEGVETQAKSMSRVDFLQKFSVEKGLKFYLPPHALIPTNMLDPFEYDSWEEIKDSEKSKKYIAFLTHKIKSGEKLPPVLVKGLPNDINYRPMVLDGHHRVAAYLHNDVAFTEVYYDDATLNQLWVQVRRN